MTVLSGQGRLEFERVQELRESNPAHILDIGGATGVHALRPTERGHAVVMIDPLPEQGCPRPRARVLPRRDRRRT